MNSDNRSPYLRGQLLWRSLVLCSSMLTALFSQGPQQKLENVNDLIEKVKQGRFAPVMLEQIARAGAVSAIPALEAQFATNRDPAMRGALASALVRLGDRGQIYWDFLVDRAKNAIDSDAPYPRLLDSNGRTVPNALSPDFVDWAKARNVPPEVAARYQVQDLPGDLILLAITGDPRGRDLLVRGMVSRNYLVQAISAKGLAKLRDKDSIPLIIEACAKVPSEPSELIARSLVFFDDPRAQRAAEMFIRDRQVLEELQRLMKEKGPSAVF